MELRRHALLVCCGLLVAAGGGCVRPALTDLAPACRAAAGGAAADTAGWQTLSLDGGEVSLRLPPGFRPAPPERGAMAVDSRWDSWTAGGGRTVGVGRGHQGPPERRTWMREFSQCADTIGGRAAVVTTYRTERAYGVEAVWAGALASPVFADLKVSAFSPDGRDQESMLAVARSVRFTPGR